MSQPQFDPDLSKPKFNNKSKLLFRASSSNDFDTCLDLLQKGASVDFYNHH